MTRRTDERRLDDGEVALDQREDGHDQLDRVSEGGVEESSEGLTDSEGELLSGKRQQRRERDLQDENSDSGQLRSENPKPLMREDSR